MKTEQPLDREIALALRRLADQTVVPPVEAAREAALMAAFDAAQTYRGTAPRGRHLWGMAGLATAAAVLIAVGLGPALTGRHGISSDATRASHKPLPSAIRGAQLDPRPPGEFVMVPGAAWLPAMESGSLVRMDVPVAMLPSLGVTPPASQVIAVRADLIVGQDGLPRAVRLVN
jgi:hypothetical protein